MDTRRYGTILDNRMAPRRGRLCQAGLLTGVAAILTAAPALANSGATPANGPDPAPEQIVQSETATFDIPAQPLGEALTRLAEQSGLQVAYTTQEVEGRTSAAVAGDFTPEAALHQMLAGTGLTYRFTDAGTATIEQMAAGQESEGALELGAVEVQGWRPTETRGYRPGMISSATKTQSPIADTPASVSVVTEDVIKDQNARSVADAVRNVPGVEPGPNPANVSVQEEFTIRGFANTLVNVNGVERRSTGPLSTANIQSIEVLKGPFSVMQGQLSPGGFINVQTKRPQREAAYEVTGGLTQATTGRGTTGRGVVDATGPITEDETLLYRFIASADGGSSFIDEVAHRRVAHRAVEQGQGFVVGFGFLVGVDQFVSKRGAVGVVVNQLFEQGHGGFVTASADLLLGKLERVGSSGGGALPRRLLGRSFRGGRCGRVLCGSNKGAETESHHKSDSEAALKSRQGGRGSDGAQRACISHSS